MKLIFCDVCWDIFKLAKDVRTCACGKCTGKYNEDGHTAVVNGHGYSLAIGNGSLVKALRPLETYEGNNKNDYIDNCRVEYTWARPHAGLGNPRSTIDPTLKKGPDR